MEIEKGDIAVVIGNTGGIGHSLFKTLEKDKRFAKVYGFNRHQKPILDLFEESSIENVAKLITTNKEKIKLLFIATGFLHDNKKYPEKKISDIDENFIKNTFFINTIGVALVIKHFCPLMDHLKKSHLICLSARVGSIEDNFLGGWYSYRASKAALNQIMKTCAIEFKRKKSELIFLSMHPGTVKTKLSEPFANPNRKMFSPEESTEKILNTVEKVDIGFSGKLLDYDGNLIPY